MTANWFTIQGDEKRKNLFFRARRRFTVDQPSSSAARLRIGAESYYKLWINGVAVADGPARGSRSVNIIDTHLVAPFLIQGENHLAVLVQCMNIPNYTSAAVGAALAVELEGFPDGPWECLENEEWAHEPTILCPQVGFMEWRDHRLTPQGWQTFKDRESWKPVRVLSPMNLPFRGKRPWDRTIPHMGRWESLPRRINGVFHLQAPEKSEEMNVAERMTHEAHRPDVRQSAALEPLLHAGRWDLPLEGDGGDVAVIIDFGRERIGFLEIELTAEEGVCIDIGYEEALVDGRLIAARPPYFMADRHVTRAGGQTLGNSLHDRGFRFVELAFRGLTRGVVLHSVKVVERRYPLNPIGTFSCSDAQLNRIWSLCVRTQETCTVDTVLDPWRERAFWINDHLMENKVSLQVFGESRLAAHSLRLAFSNRRADGLIPGVCPDTGSDRLVLPATNLFLGRLLLDYLLYTGDTSLVKELLPVFEEILDRFEEWRGPDGILPPKGYWNFIDWSYELLGASLDGKRTSVLDWFYVDARNRAADLCMHLGEDRAAHHRTLAQHAANRIHSLYWLPAQQRFSDWMEEAGSPSRQSSQLVHALALLSGGLLPDKQDSCERALDDDTLRIPELYMHYIVLQAMGHFGHMDVAMARVRKYWGMMVDLDEPTLWENGVYPQGRKSRTMASSHCHGFSTAPIDYFQTWILGIRPLKPGFLEFEVRPYAHDLTSAAGCVPTPRGPIYVSWKRQKKFLETIVEIPHGTTGVTADSQFGPGVHHIEFPLLGISDAR